MTYVPFLKLVTADEVVAIDPTDVDYYHAIEVILSSKGYTHINVLHSFFDGKRTSSWDDVLDCVNAASEDLDEWTGMIWQARHLKIFCKSPTTALTLSLMLSM